MILVLVGKSGSGKSTLADYFDKEDILKKVITVTTRPKRKDEKSGVDYHFYTEREFIMGMANDIFIETESYNDWHYGALKSSIHKDENQVLILTPSGLKRFKEWTNKNGIVVKSVYLDVDDDTRMARCMAVRDDKEEVKARFKRDTENHRDARFMCDLTIINDNFEYSTEEIAKRIGAAFAIY